MQHDLWVSWGKGGGGEIVEVGDGFGVAGVGGTVGPGGGADGEEAGAADGHAEFTFVQVLERGGCIQC